MFRVGGLISWSHLTFRYDTAQYIQPAEYSTLMFPFVVHKVAFHLSANPIAAHGTKQVQYLPPFLLVLSAFETKNGVEQ